MIHSFSRAEMLLGSDSMQKLKNAKVVVFGIGGVGSYTAEGLARCGVGNIVLIDNDTVTLTNINRQLHALHSTLGQPKTDVMKSRILDINPDCNVTTINGFCLPENIDDFFYANYDCIVDAIDTISGKIAIAEKAFKENIPLISCMGMGNKLNPLMIEVSDIHKTTVCPVCRVMRTELKKRGINKLKAVYSKEKPVKPLESDEVTGRRCALGSVSFVPSVAGLIIAGEAVRAVTV